MSAVLNDRYHSRRARVLTILHRKPQGATSRDLEGLTALNYQTVRCILTGLEREKLVTCAYVAGRTHSYVYTLASQPTA